MLRRISTAAHTERLLLNKVRTSGKSPHNSNIISPCNTSRVAAFSSLTPKRLGLSGYAVFLVRTSEDPSLSHVVGRERAAVLGQMWRDLPDSKKKEYIDIGTRVASPRRSGWKCYTKGPQAGQRRQPHAYAKFVKRHYYTKDIQKLRYSTERLAVIAKMWKKEKEEIAMKKREIEREQQAIYSDEGKRAAVTSSSASSRLLNKEKKIIKMKKQPKKSSTAKKRTGIIGAKKPARTVKKLATKKKSNEKMKRSSSSSSAGRKKASQTKKTRRSAARA